MKRITIRGVCLGLVTVLLVACVSSPPVQEMSDARQAIKVAVDADANTYAPELLKRAGLLLKAAEDKLARRSFKVARREALKARDMAMRALRKAELARGGD